MWHDVSSPLIWHAADFGFACDVMPFCICETTFCNLQVRAVSNIFTFILMYFCRADTLDPALLRPGRLDRKIEFPLPDRRQKRLIFSTITAKMNLSEEVDLEDYVARPDRISGADINAICQEAGMHAVRENRYIVLAKDFEKGYKNNIKKDESEHEFYK